MSVSSDTKKFLAFITFMMVWAAIGGMVFPTLYWSNWLPMVAFFVWIFGFLAGVGFIIKGWEGMVTLVGTTAMSWGIIGGLGLTIGYLLSLSAVYNP